MGNVFELPLPCLYRVVLRVILILGVIGPTVMWECPYIETMS